MSDDSDLKPCPHCGGKARSYHRRDDTGFSNTDWICCDSGDDGITPNCGAGTCLWETREQAAAAWNRRTTTLAQPRLAASAAIRNAEILRAVASLDAARNLLSASASDIAHSKRFVDDIDLMCAVLLSQVD